VAQQLDLRLSLLPYCHSLKFSMPTSRTKGAHDFRRVAFQRTLAIKDGHESTGHRSFLHQESVISIIFA
jgi:hypothetical protein